MLFSLSFFFLQSRPQKPITPMTFNKSTLWCGLIMGPVPPLLQHNASEHERVEFVKNN
jgi:hypothetical protein